MMRSQIRAEIAAIEPFDAVEREHIADALQWIDSGVELCRLEKPATPPKHLVSYCVLIDERRVLLVDHKNAQLWLPAGGHVDPGEHPRATVAREIQEEVGLTLREEIAGPLMITCSRTVGLTAGHEDVSLWYVIEGQREQTLMFDAREFNSVRWFRFDEVPFGCCDPHMKRFLNKLAASRRYF